MVTSTRRQRAQKVAYLPSPLQIRERALALRRANGDSVPDALPPIHQSDIDDWQAEYDQQQKLVASMTPKQRRAMEEAERIEGERLAEEDRLRAKGDLIRNLAHGEAQRRASVNAGTPVKEGKDIPHYRAFEARTVCLVSLGMGTTPDELMAAHGLKSDKRVREWLAGLSQELGEGTYVIARVKSLDSRDPPVWRVVDARSVPLKLKDGRPLDKGGTTSKRAAQEQADAINEAARRRHMKKPTRKQRRAGRSSEIARSRKERGGAVHLRKEKATQPQTEEPCPTTPKD